ncbi:MAG: hypothetical protein Q4C61_01220 [Lachnospiraceae bacterium]|nr:hypothetical protein [Lachnospiraceae bacterium]
MIAKKIPIAAALMAGMMLLGGCEMMEQKKWTPQEADAISIDEDGVITEIIQETLDQPYYDAAELQSRITSEVADYNAKNGEDAVSVKEMEAADGKINLKMEYASAQDYASFNNTEFYYGSVINAQLSGYLFDVSYKKVNGGVVQGSSVSGSEVIKRMDKQVLILRAPVEVHVPGEVLFTSTNAEVLAADVVNATGESDDKEDEGLILPSNAVYKAEDDASFAEMAAANRVYIIFDM